MRFDGITEYENESWSDTVENLKNFPYQKLDTQRVGIERAHTEQVNQKMMVQEHLLLAINLNN